MLFRWLQARFPSLPILQETLSALSTHSAWDTHTRITDLFLTLVRAQHAEGTVDPEVQIGLGVLYYTNGEFGKAKDCFESALALRPKVCYTSSRRADTQFMVGLSFVESIRVFPVKWQQARRGSWGLPTGTPVATNLYTCYLQRGRSLYVIESIFHGC